MYSVLEQKGHADGMYGIQHNGKSWQEQMLYCVVSH